VKNKLLTLAKNRFQMKSGFLKGTHARYRVLQVKKVYFWGGNGTAQRRRDMKASVLGQAEGFAIDDD